MPYSIDLPILLKIEAIEAKGMANPVTFNVGQGELWMLSGVSGVGKSQFLKALADLIPHSGEAWLNGIAQEAICPATWRGKVMYFAAETAWWLDSMSAHFESPPSEALLHSIGLTQSILERHPDDCSSGEKQRLALLRGLALQPAILLLDEITANLDFDSTLKVEQLLQSYLQPEGIQPIPERAIIWITHDVMQGKRLFLDQRIIQLSSKGSV